MSTEEKYAAPPPGYDDATKLPGGTQATSVPTAGVTPTATTQPQPQGKIYRISPISYSEFKTH